MMRKQFSGWRTGQSWGFNRQLLYTFLPIGFNTKWSNLGWFWGYPKFRKLPKDGKIVVPFLKFGRNQFMAQGTEHFQLGFSFIFCSPTGHVQKVERWKCGVDLREGERMGLRHASGIENVLWIRVK
jgi:hypothetical protein